MRYWILSIALGLVIGGCSSNRSTTLDTEKQEIVFFAGSLAESGLVVQVDSNVYRGERTCVRIFFKDGRFRLHRGYIDCRADSMRFFELNEKSIEGCDKKLFIERDTIKICLTPEQEGPYDFHRISLLFSDTRDHYYTGDTTFSIMVRSKK